MSSLEATSVFDILSEGGAEVRFVGGCVRDAVLGRAIRDIDIATGAPPERVVELLEAAKIKVIPTGIAHGTLTAVVDRKPVEITTLRRDVETDGRHANVEFTDSWTEDASRRDFTINAISLERDGTLHDPFGGLEDLTEQRVRFVGTAKARIREDVLRLLRYFRIFAHYGQPPADEEALSACRELAPLLPQLSAERVRTELLKTLEAQTAGDVMRLMRDQGILDHFLPEAVNIDRLSQLVELEATRQVNDPLRRLAAMLVLNDADLAALSARLRLSNAQSDRLAAIAANGTVIVPALSEAVRDALLYRVGVPAFRDAALIGWADASTDDGWAALIAACDDWQAKKFPLHGTDVMALGVPSGPKIGAVLQALEDWWIEGGFRADRASCLRQLKEFVGQVPH